MKENSKIELKPQITVFMENQPGSLAKVCELIMDLNINIQAFTVAGTVDHGVMRVIVNRPQAVLDRLAQEGWLAIQSNVLGIPAENTPGILYRISTLLAEDKVNIEYGYGSSNPSAVEQFFFLQASDNQKALAILERACGAGDRLFRCE